MTKPYDPDNGSQKSELVEAMMDFFEEVNPPEDLPEKYLKLMGCSFRAGWAARMEMEVEL